MIDDMLKSAGRSRDRRDWPTCVWFAEEAFNFGRVGRPAPPTQSP
jgi:hypothetical protein